ncbi:MAG: aminopeptidase [Gemmatimonadota bacterium]|nr:aminopeptidase [Gemmatimonadota bacterium]
MIRGGMRRGALAAVLIASAVLLTLFTGCSPVYVLKAGWAEAKILNARRPLPDVIADTTLDGRARGKLTLVMEAREFAQEDLELDVGDSYTTYAALDRDTLAMVLSAAHRDRIVSKTWWFPVVGHVPYKGFFDLDDAQREQSGLEAEGFDTYLRPTAAFSTLGWFSDPLLSTLMRYDEVELVETVLHELSHNHLFVPGRVQFNESFATWVGRNASMAFFCGRPGGGTDTVWCKRATDRWADEMRFSVFIDGLVEELQAVYGDSTRSYDDKLAARDSVFGAARNRFRTEVQPGFRSLTFGSFLTTPLNNATLLSRMRYYHRLPDFQALLEDHGGSLQDAIETLRLGAEGGGDPFDLLPTDPSPGAL